MYLFTPVDDEASLQRVFVPRTGIRTDGKGVRNPVKSVVSKDVGHAGR